MLLGEKGIDISSIRSCFLSLVFIDRDVEIHFYVHIYWWLVTVKLFLLISICPELSTWPQNENWNSRLPASVYFIQINSASTNSRASLAFLSSFDPSLIWVAFVSTPLRLRVSNPATSIVHSLSTSNPLDGRTKYTFWRVSVRFPRL